MIEVLRQQFSKDMPAEEKLNRSRELLQIIVLKILHDKGVFDNLVFTGGTALRILFNLRRFSEDLDFSLVHKKGYEFGYITSELTRGFKLYGLNMESKPKTKTNVHSAFLKFSGLLKELGLSPLARQNLSVKIDIDTNPPVGGNIKNTVINKTFMLNIAHFDLPSMFATKLHACFYRKFTKGRDFYDFIWYLSNKIEPNYALLNNAIKQTQGKNPKINKNNINTFLLESVKKINFDLAKKDVERFLQDKNELKLFNFETMKSAIESF